MPEFRCSNCQKLLRTPPGSEGKQAKCPQCGALQEIPAQSAFTPPPREPEFAPSAFTPPAPSSAGSSNPFQSPSAASMAPETAPRGFQPTPIDLGDTLGRAWQIYRDNLAAVVGGGVLAVVMIFAAGALSGVAGAVLAELIGGSEGQIVSFLIEQIVSQGATAFFWVGVARYMLPIARGEGAQIGLLFSGGPLLGRGFVIQIVTAFATGLGFLLLIIPGIIIALMLSQSLFVLADRQTGIRDSLNLSIAAMKGNKLTVFGLYLVTALLGFAVMLFTCGIGLFFYLPFMLLLASVVYLGVTGQQTVLDAPADPRAERAFSAFGGQPPQAPAV